jgi:peptidoglycan/LPS O-acetylase OafA/YrhL
VTGDRWCKSHEEYLSVRYFSSLDGLRAISILLVIWHHAVGGEGILGRGHHGVGLFFAISGFLITTLLVREHSEHGSINIRAFYLRRALRIFPLYYAVLAIYTLGWFLGTRGTPIGDGFLENLPAFATYTTNWFVQLEPGEPVAFYHAWSLATEEQFYLLWPPVLIALLPYARGLRAAGLVVATMAATDVAVTRLTDGDSFLRTVITSVATPICAGALMATSNALPCVVQAPSADPLPAMGFLVRIRAGRVMSRHCRGLYGSRSLVRFSGGMLHRA